MYAVVKTGGKQYRVEPGTLVDVESLSGEVGDAVTLGDVLLVADGDDVRVGQPTVQGASVTAKIIEQKRGKKLIIFKKTLKSTQLKKGHRQELTRLKVEDIKLS